MATGPAGADSGELRSMLEGRASGLHGPLRFAVRGLLAAVGVVALCAGLSGCGSMGDEGISSALVAPGKYELNNCQDIENQMRSRRARVADLEQLMAKASEGAGGEFVSAIAYRSEYHQNRAELAELVRTAERKHCTSQSPWTSQRALF
jgi:hypothetical protein